MIEFTKAVLTTPAGSSGLFLIFFSLLRILVFSGLISAVLLLAIHLTASDVRPSPQVSHVEPPKEPEPPRHQPDRERVDTPIGPVDIEAGSVDKGDASYIFYYLPTFLTWKLGEFTYVTLSQTDDETTEIPISELKTRLLSIPTIEKKLNEAQIMVAIGQSSNYSPEGWTIEDHKRLARSRAGALVEALTNYFPVGGKEIWPCSLGWHEIGSFDPDSRQDRAGRRIMIAALSGNVSQEAFSEIMTQKFPDSASFYSIEINEFTGFSEISTCWQDVALGD